MFVKKYEEKDFEDYGNGKITFEELKTKYGVSSSTLYKALNRRKIYSRKTRIIITSPHGQPKIVDSITEMCEELGISMPTAYRALSGKKVSILEELGIKVEKLDK